MITFTKFIIITKNMAGTYKIGDAKYGGFIVLSGLYFSMYIEGNILLVFSPQPRDDLRKLLRKIMLQFVI